MQRKTLGTALTLAGSLVLSATAWAGDADRGAMLGNTCAGCHGTLGASTGPATPNIAGFQKDTLVDIMKAYKSDERPSTIMGRIAKGYSDAEIEAMSAYFAAQKPVFHPQEGVDAARAEAGKGLHDKYCEKCHEESGRIDDAGSTILAGQMLPYLTFSIEDFNSGAREMPKKMKKKMEDMLEKEGPESLHNIVHFYASQK